jgi:hypothetical protein
MKNIEHRTTFVLNFHAKITEHPAFVSGFIYTYPHSSHDVSNTDFVTDLPVVAN